MIIIINGEKKEFDADITLSNVLKKLSLDDKVMAAAINMEIVKQNLWNTQKFNDGDKLELLDFVGGG